LDKKDFDPAGVVSFTWNFKVGGPKFYTITVEAYSNEGKMGYDSIVIKGSSF